MLRQWAKNYSYGDVVITLLDGKITFAICIQHTGDGHHKFTVVTVENTTDCSEDGKPQDRLTAVGKTFFGYYIGPKIHRLNSRQIMCLEDGLMVDELVIDTPAAAFAEILNYKR